MCASRRSGADHAASGIAKVCCCEASDCVNATFDAPPSESEAIAWTKPDAAPERSLMSETSFSPEDDVVVLAASFLASPTLSMVMVSPAASRVARLTSKVVCQYWPAAEPQGLRTYSMPLALL